MRRSYSRRRVLLDFYEEIETNNLLSGESLLNNFQYCLKRKMRTERQDLHDKCFNKSSINSKDGNARITKLLWAWSCQSNREKVGRERESTPLIICLSLFEVSRVIFLSSIFQLINLIYFTTLLLFLLLFILLRWSRSLLVLVFPYIFALYK